MKKKENLDEKELMCDFIINRVLEVPIDCWEINYTNGHFWNKASTSINGVGVEFILGSGMEPTVIVDGLKIKSDTIYPLQSKLHEKAREIDDNKLKRVYDKLQ